MKRILTTLSQKWPEYLLEMMVITAGILGAFVLNDWKEKRDDLIEEQRILTGLKEEFDTNLQEVNRNIKKLSESTFKAKYTEVDLLQLENLIYRHKLNNDMVNLNEYEMKKFFVETLEIISDNLED